MVDRWIGNNCCDASHTGLAVYVFISSKKLIATTKNKNQLANGSPGFKGARVTFVLCTLSRYNSRLERVKPHCCISHCPPVLRSLHPKPKAWLKNNFRLVTRKLFLNRSKRRERSTPFTRDLWWLQIASYSKLAEPGPFVLVDFDCRANNVMGHFRCFGKQAMHLRLQSRKQSENEKTKFLCYLRFLLFNQSSGTSGSYCWANPKVHNCLVRRRTRWAIN